MVSPAKHLHTTVLSDDFKEHKSHDNPSEMPQSKKDVPIPAWENQRISLLQGKQYLVLSSPRQ